MRIRVSILSQLLLCSAAVFAQGTLATITGTLLDPNSNPVTGLSTSVHMKDPVSGAEFTAPVSEKGDYTVSGLPGGTYDLSVPLVGAMYRTYLQKSVTVTAGKTLRMDLHIAWGINLGTIGDDPTMLNDDMRRKAKNTSGPTPRMADGKPDLSGMWVPVRMPEPANPIPMQPWAEEIQKKLQARSSYNQGPAAYCLPQSAVPMTLPFPWKLVQTPTLLVHITEFTTPGYRQIFMDGRPHPKDWNPAWMGHSVGTWEGDTLVVDSTGFNESAPGYGVHTEKLHIVERIRRPDKGHLEDEITAEDPDAYTKPWKRTIHGALVPDEEILEFVCPENNKDPLHFGGLGWSARP